MFTYRGNLTAVHGLLFGTFFLLAAYALFVELLRSGFTEVSGRVSTLTRTYFVFTAAAGWAAVLSGTYIVYPWYRAVPPTGADLRDYPKSLLLSNASTVGLHSVGMEWKEHIAFLAPIAFTMLAYVLCRYGSGVARQPQLRRLLLTFAATAMFATGIAGAAGALLNKAAPTEGPRKMHALQPLNGAKA